GASGPGRRPQVRARRAGGGAEGHLPARARTGNQAVTRARAEEQGMSATQRVHGSLRPPPVVALALLAVCGCAPSAPPGSSTEAAPTRAATADKPAAERVEPPVYPPPTVERG